MEVFGQTFYQISKISWISRSLCKFAFLINLGAFVNICNILLLEVHSRYRFKVGVVIVYFYGELLV
jgi:hypothetical protein